VGIKEDGVGFRDEGAHAAVDTEVAIAQSVVKKKAGALGGAVRHADDVGDGDVLAESASDSVDSR